jgi:hypothetical protein
MARCRALESQGTHFLPPERVLAPHFQTVLRVSDNYEGEDFGRVKIDGFSTIMGLA